jgi:hypothetical protein
MDSDPIWKRRLELERAERKEREALLEPLHEKYRASYEALQVECEARENGHEWRFTTHYVRGEYGGVVGQSFFRCNYCAKSRIED